jgi:Flp pilus assembly protein TadG
MKPIAPAALPHAPRRARGQRGSAVVELALVLGLLVTMLAAIFGFGRAFWYYDALSKSTRDAARAFSVADVGTIATLGVPAAKQTVVDAATLAGLPNFSTANVSVTCLGSIATNYANGACVDGGAPGGVRVAIVGYTLSIGQYIPFLVGGASQYAAPLAPQSTFRYMP